MPSHASSSMYIADTVSDALMALFDDEGAEILAGATWSMRAPIRGQSGSRRHVAISKIDELRRIDISDDEIRIGSCVTHDRLHAALAPLGEWHGQ